MNTKKNIGVASILFLCICAMIGPISAYFELEQVGYLYWVNYLWFIVFVFYIAFKSAERTFISFVSNALASTAYVSIIIFIGYVVAMNTSYGH